MAGVEEESEVVKDLFDLIHKYQVPTPPEDLAVYQVHTQHAAHNTHTENVELIDTHCILSVPNRVSGQKLTGCALQWTKALAIRSSTSTSSALSWTKTSLSWTKRPRKSRMRLRYVHT